MGKLPAPVAQNVTGHAPPGRSTDIWEYYTKGEVLGRGAFGVVYEATHKETGRRRAVKTISKGKLVSKEDVADVQREMQILLLVGDHRHVAALKDTFEDTDYVYFVLELCKGGELFDAIVERGTFSEHMAAAHFKTMVEVVHHCHTLGVIHRDIKPENFLLTTKGDDGVLKAADFGLSTYFSPGQIFSGIVGSAFYVAPEVLRRRYGFQADMWSLGVILYILLSGLPPFWGETEEAIFKMILRAPVDLQSTPWVGVSEPAKDLIMRLLQRNPAQRATAQQALAHPWLVEQGVAPRHPLDNVVLRRLQRFAAMNKLKRAALLVMAQNLSPAELAGLQHLFSAIDADGSGSITAAELRAALEGLGEKIPEDDLQELVRCADIDGDGTIDWEEFLAATCHLNRLTQNEHLQRAFAHFDRDNSGDITADEIMEALKGQGVSQSEADELLAEWDANRDGVISWDEFKAAMTHNEDPSWREGRREVRSTKVEGLLEALKSHPSVPLPDHGLHIEVAQHAAVS